jgi:hypothetical protein
MELFLLEFCIKIQFIPNRKSCNGADFLPVLRFPLPVLIPPTAPHSSISGAGTIGQLVADISSGLSLTPPQDNKKKYTTSQETYYFSATETNRLLLLRETVSVYCENHTEHTNTLCGQNALSIC